jgi:glycosyltransferase involved in cell wall biosynthesis
LKPVLYLIANSEIGGAENATFTIMSNHKNYLPHAIFFSDGPMVERCKAAGIITTVLKSSVRLRKPWTFPLAAREISLYIRKNNIILIHSCMSYAYLVGAIAARLTKTTSVLFHHGPYGGKLDDFANRIGAPTLLTNSDFMVGRIKEKTGNIAFKIPLGISADNFKGNAESILKKPKGSRFVTCIGRIDRNKGQLTAIEGMKNLLKEDKTLRLVLIGSSLPGLESGYLSELKNSVFKNGIEDKVIFIESQKNIFPYLELTDIFLHCSFEEAHGLVILEAMSKGVPVVATNVGGIPEIIEEGVSGLLYEAGNGSMLGDKVEVLLQDEVLRKRLGEAGQEFSAENYSIENTIVAVEEVYKKILPTD